MRQLTGLDTAFLRLEAPSTPMHTMGLLLLEAAPSVSMETIEGLLIERMHLLPPLGQCVVEPPLRFDRPVLVDDPDFDIRKHVVRVPWDRPGTLADLDRAVGTLASRPLDRSRPLWEAWLFDRLEGGACAIAFKLHHAIVDGMSAALFLAQLLDTDPQVNRTGEAVSVRRVGDAQPGGPKRLVQSLWNQASQPLRAARAALDVARGVRELWSERWGGGGDHPSWPLPIAPRTDFDGHLDARREVARGSAPLENLLVIKKAFDATVNDVLLAACTLALRRQLAADGGLPRRPLVASVPVSIRDASHEAGGNRVSNMLVRLPVQLDRAEDVVRYVRRETRSAKRAHEVLGSRLLEAALEVTSPLALGWLARQHERLGLASLHPPACNIIVSNIPGPPLPLYCAGARVRAAYPFGPLLAGAPVNLTALSYAGRMDLGVISCPRRTSQAGPLVQALEDAVASLVDTAEGLGRREPALGS